MSCSTALKFKDCFLSVSMITGETDSCLFCRLTRTRSSGSALIWVRMPYFT